MANRFAPISKITRPRLSQIVPRKRLFIILEECCRKAATWISAPGGSGKTSLIISYLAAFGIPCLWYTLDAGDADASNFFYFLGLAIKETLPRCRKPMPLLTPEYFQGINVFTRRYFEELGRRVKAPFVIVLDNYHNVPDECQLHEIISAAMTSVPEGINFFVLSRQIPPPAFINLRSQEKIALLGWNEVRCTEDESREIIKLKERHNLDAEIIKTLHKKTQGWVAGLVLLMENLRSGDIDYKALDRLMYDEIFEYFATEIFRRTDARVQEFLLKTAFLPSMTASTAEVHTGIKTSGRILSSLHADNYFIERHLKSNFVYNYHPLFREFLLMKAKETFGRNEIIRIQKSAAALLLKDGQAENAAALLIEVEDWSGLTSLILAQAPALIGQGRSKILNEWLSAVPDEILQTVPWLLYWKGICILPLNPAGSRQSFERAFGEFETRQDEAGTLLAWIGVVETLFFEFDDFTPLDRWIDWMDARVRLSPSYPSSEIEIAVAAGMSCALLWRRPAHPDIRHWMRRALSSLSNANTFLHVNAPISAVTFHSWMGEVSEGRIVMNQIKKIAGSEPTSPLFRIALKFIETHLFILQPGEFDNALRSASEGFDIAEETGVHLLDSMFVSQLAFGALISGKRSLTEEYLDKMEIAMGPGRRGVHAVYYSILSLYNMKIGNFCDAAVCAKKAVSITEETGIPFPEGMSRILVAQADFELGNHESAELQLARAENIFSLIGSRYFEYTCILIKSYFGFVLGREGEALEALRHAFILGKKMGYSYAPYFWRQDVMSRLCLKALEAGIEVEYVGSLIRKLNLLPDSSNSHIENWPWPLKIYTLGLFEVRRDGKRLEFPVKAPRRIISLLKLLISFGKNGAGEERLADLLWPDPNADAALQSLTTSIHRLRQLLGNDRAVQLRDGIVKLDSDYCWIDAHVFEKLVDQTESGGKQLPLSTDVQDKLIEKAVLIYKGEFLSESIEPWVHSYRERLREKYLRAVKRLGRRYESLGKFDMAIDHYQKGIEIEPMAEEFYFLIMKCYAALGRKAEAITVYKKCKHLFQTVFGVDPSPETTALFESLTGTSPRNTVR